MLSKRKAPASGHESVLACSDEELARIANEWTIEGKDLISEVTCSEPYEWKELTDDEWEFSKPALERLKKKPFHVSSSPAFK